MKKAQVITVSCIVVALINAMAIYKVGLSDVITFYDHFLWAVFGALAWCFGLFRFEKNKIETKNRKEGTALKFDFDNYKNENWEDWIWTFIFCFPIVKYSADLFDVVHKYYELPIYDAYYLCAGPLSVAVGYGMNWIINKFA